MRNGWELNAHSYEQIPMHKLDDQRAVITKSMDIIEKFGIPLDEYPALRGWVWDFRHLPGFIGMSGIFPAGPA